MKIIEAKKLNQEIQILLSGFLLIIVDYTISISNVGELDIFHDIIGFCLIMYSSLKILKRNISERISLLMKIFIIGVSLVIGISLILSFTNWGNNLLVEFSTWLSFTLVGFFFFIMLTVFRIKGFTLALKKLKLSFLLYIILFVSPYLLLSIMFSTEDELLQLFIGFMFLFIILFGIIVVFHTFYSVSKIVNDAKRIAVNNNKSTA